MSRVPGSGTHVSIVNMFLLVVLLLTETVVSQTFADYPLPPAIQDTTAACIQALNTTVECPASLLQISIDLPLLDNTTLAELCVDSCSSSLQSVRQGIQQACDGYFDFIVDNGVLYPSTYVADKFIFAYDLACLIDTTTNDYCHNTISGFDQNPGSIPNDTYLECHNCVFGMEEIYLDSPLGYSDDLASTFSAATSSCSVSQYSYTSPAAYVINTQQPTPIPNNTVSCASTYTVQAGDTCNSIAQSQSVSTESLRRANMILNSCDGLPDAGGSLCVPTSCSIYVVQDSDTCSSIISAAGISSVQLLTWNPSINSMCGNLVPMIGEAVCISQPGSAPPCAQAVATTTVSPTTATSVPTNADSNSNTDCANWYTVQSGDYCKSISLAQSISLQDFYFLNPDINSDCSNLYLGLAYCVEAVGSISTYSGYPQTTPFITLTSMSYSTSAVATLDQWTLPIPPVQTLMPLAPNSLSGCAQYQNYIDSTTVQSYDDSDPSDNTTSVALLNDCGYVADAYNVNVTQMLEWNPSLGSNATDCSLQAGYSYCVVRNSTDELPPPTACVMLNATMDGTSSQCNCFTELVGDDVGTYNCTDIASDFNTTVSDILMWNTWLGSDCDDNLYANMTSDDLRSVCAGIDPSLPIASTS